MAAADAPPATPAGWQARVALLEREMTRVLRELDELDELDECNQVLVQQLRLRRQEMQLELTTARRAFAACSHRAAV
jgi:hypothetical protein